jgi:signal transduction histidine kinase
MTETPARSLSARLVRDLAIVQAAAVILWMLALMTVSPYISYEELAAASSQPRVAAAVARRNGVLEVAPSAALAGYAARRPGFAYAVVSGDRILAGSSPELARRLEPIAGALPGSGVLELRLGDRKRVVRLSPARTPYGEVAVATAGDAFKLEDLGAFLATYLPQFALMFGPAILAAALVIPLVVRHLLRPLRTAAAQAAAIEVSSLDRRLPDEGAPSELRPFIGAINTLLRRVEEGVARQRMFTANAAHELRTPVAILNARVDLMPDGPEKWAMKRDVRRLAVLIDQLLSAARLERSEAADQAVDVATLGRDLVSDMAPLAIRSGRQIRFSPPAQPGLVRGDGQALRSALANLVDNALRTEPEGGSVELRMTARDGRVTVDVADHGPGVAPEDRELVFEPFWRKTGREPGAGLGLSIARTIARLHRGSLTVSETPGGGATFTLELPAARAP